MVRTPTKTPQMDLQTRFFKKLVRYRAFAYLSDMATLKDQIRVVWVIAALFVSSVGFFIYPLIHENIYRYLPWTEASPQNELYEQVEAAFKEGDEGAWRSILSEVEDDGYLLALRAYSLMQGFLGFSRNEERAQKLGLRAFTLLQREDDASARAMLAKGLLLYGGVGVGQQADEGMRLFEKAAGGGSVIAMHAAAVANASKDPPDESAAFYWYMRAAEQGDIDAKAIAGARLIDGVGTVIDLEAGIELLEEADASGSARAAYSLGQVYRLGLAGATDFAAAEAAYRRSYERGATSAGGPLGLLALDRDANEEAGPVLTAAAEAGYVLGHLGMSILLASPWDGKHTTRPDDEGMQNLIAAADQGLDIALFELAVRRLGAEAYAIDHEEARKRLEVCADMSPNCRIILAAMLSEGLGGPVDIERAEKLSRSIVDGDVSLGGGNFPMTDAVAAEAAHQLADMLSKHGTDSIEVSQKRVTLLNRAIALNPDNGAPRATLAAIYASGAPGVPKDEARALRLYEEAARLGSSAGVCGLAFWMHNGLSGVQDSGRAMALYLEALSMGNLGIFDSILKLVEAGVEPPSQEEIMAAIETGFALAEQAALMDGCLSNAMGIRYMDNRLTSEDPDAASFWFSRAADHGISAGALNLGRLHLAGAVSSPDVAFGLEQVRRAVDMGSSSAKALYARLLTEGVLLERDDREIMRLIVEIDCESVTEEEIAGLPLAQTICRPELASCNASIDRYQLDAAEPEGEIAAELPELRTMVPLNPIGTWRHIGPQ